MKKIVLSLAVGMLAVGLTGCIVVGVQRKASSDDVITTPVATTESVAFAEIDAAAKLDFDNARANALNAIAARPSLSTAAQVHLIDRVLKRLDFENSKVLVLHTLIQNASFSNPAKQTILANIDKIAFNNNRVDMLAWINQRGELKE